MLRRPSSVPGGFPPGHGRASYQNRAVAVTLLPASDSDQCKSFLSHVQLVCLEVCETALGRLPCPPASAWEPHWARGSHGSGAVFAPSRQRSGPGKESVFSLPLCTGPSCPSLQMNGVTCVPSARPLSEDQQRGASQTSLSPGSQEGRCLHQTCLSYVPELHWRWYGHL